MLSEILEWSVLVYVVPTFLAIRGAVMSSSAPNFPLVKGCFIFAALLLLARFVLWISMHEGPGIYRTLSTAGVFAVVGLITFGLLEWVRGYEISEQLQIYEVHGSYYTNDPTEKGLDKPIPLDKSLTLIRDNDAVITLGIGNKSSQVLSDGSDVVVTVHAKKADVQPTTKLGDEYVWRRLKVTDKWTSFAAKISDTIPPGTLIKTPNEELCITLPPGDKYKIEYLVQGKSETNHAFSVHSHYWIKITASKTPPASGTPSSPKSGA